MSSLPFFSFPCLNLDFLGSACGDRAVSSRDCLFLNRGNARSGGLAVCLLGQIGILKYNVFGCFLYYANEQEGQCE